jgi:F0F1-type ATP synthase assembly protein I
MKGNKVYEWHDTICVRLSHCSHSVLLFVFVSTIVGGISELFRQCAIVCFCFYDCRWYFRTVQTVCYFLQKQTIAHCVNSSEIPPTIVETKTNNSTLSEQFRNTTDNRLFFVFVSTIVGGISELFTQCAIVCFCFYDFRWYFGTVQTVCYLGE